MDYDSFVIQGKTQHTTEYPISLAERRIRESGNQDQLNNCFDNNIKHYREKAPPYHEFVALDMVTTAAVAGSAQEPRRRLVFLSRARNTEIGGAQAKYDGRIFSATIP